MKITVDAGSIYPASEEVYGSEHMAMVLADELGKNNDVTLFAGEGTPEGNYDLIEVPVPEGLNAFVSRVPITEHKDKILNSDYVIDLSALLGTVEDILWYERDSFSGVMVWGRNGTSTDHPRYPVCDLVPGTCLSKAAKRELGRKYRMSEEDLHVVPYGIDTDLYKPIVSTDYEGDYIAYTGAPRRDKGIFTILDIAERCPDERFILGWHAAGRDHKETEQEFLAELKSRDLDNVSVKQWPRNTLQHQLSLYRGAKAYLQPTDESYIEAFGLTTAEAMSCGCAAIRETWGSSPELIEHGEHGFLCETVDEYVEAIQNIDQIDPEECRQHIIDNFSSERFASDYMELYEVLA